MASGQQNRIDGGDMCARIRDFDWAKTPLGPRETWSPAPRMMVPFLLANRFPLLLWWGPHYVSIYNDAYRPVLGDKHPRALGQPASECWREIWDVLEPLIDTPFRGGPATWDDDICLGLNRHGFVEETHFTIAYSPVPGETVPGGIGGVLATVHEITGKVVGDRRVETLRDLGARSVEAKTAEEACALAAEVLEAHPGDIPFALLYLIDPDRKTARLAGAAGLDDRYEAGPATLFLDADRAEEEPWPLAEAMRDEALVFVTDLSSRLDSPPPPGPWANPPHTAAVVPIRSNKAHHLAGFLVAGLSARLPVDDSYRDFLHLVSSQIAASIANARDYEEERKRAEALAEIDRAKTDFFSNVSHEFRTPLTLMLGPLEELLDGDGADLPLAVRDRLAVAHRNGLRLLRLVNSLLDFSRIEAGRIEAAFQPTDLAAFTADLASSFRSAVERAGLRFTVDCPPAREPVHVDREMWEKVVLNLLSNAFKFTFEGEISVTLRTRDGAAELSVRDTGVGIAAEDMPRLFERFHRLPNARSRTHEGSGIGLALVQELVRQHGGSVRAESRPGEGSTFIVRVPLGKGHLPPELVRSPGPHAATPAGAAPFVEEALRWLPDSEATDAGPASAPGPVPVPGALPAEDRPRLLVADRRHAPVPRAAPRRALRRPAGPGRSGGPRGRARPPAGSRAQRHHDAEHGRPRLVEGAARRPGPDRRSGHPSLGADRRGGPHRRDAGRGGRLPRQAVQRPRAHGPGRRASGAGPVRRAAQEAIRESEERYRSLFEQAVDGIFLADPTGRYVDVNSAGAEMLGYTVDEIRGLTIADVVDPEDVARIPEQLARLEANEAVRSEWRFRRKDGSTFSGEVVGRRFPGGRVVGIVRDVTARVEAEEALREADRSKDVFLATLAHELRNPLAPNP